MKVFVSFILVHFMFSLDPALRTGRVMVLICVSVCLSVPPPESRTARYPQDTLDRQVPFGYLGHLGTFWIPWTFMYLLDTLDLYGTSWITWTFMYLLDILDLQIPFGYIGPFGNFWIPWTFMYLLELTMAYGIDIDSWY